MGGRGREGQGRGGEGGKEKGGEGRRERNRSSTFWVKFTPLKVKKAIPQKECIYRRGAHLPHVGRLSPLYRIPLLFETNGQCDARPTVTLISSKPA